MGSTRHVICDECNRSLKVLSTGKIPKHSAQNGGRIACAGSGVKKRKSLGRARRSVDAVSGGLPGLGRKR